MACEAARLARPLLPCPDWVAVIYMGAEEKAADREDYDEQQENWEEAAEETG